MRDGSFEPRDAARERDELGAFLRARRNELTPEDVGLAPEGQLRRVAGLRREEVARLACISADYYTRLERGKVPPPSASVLRSLADALHLDAEQARYLSALADRYSAPSADAEAPHPGLQTMLEHMGGLPALVLGPLTEVLSWNSAAARLFVAFEDIPRERRQIVRLVVTDDRVISRFGDWESAAATAAQLLRSRAVRLVPTDPVDDLVEELCELSTAFRAAWTQRAVNQRSHGARQFHHPELGPLDLRWQALMAPDCDTQVLLVLMPEGERSRALLSVDKMSGQPA